jgi:hypothetical protein
MSNYFAIELFFDFGHMRGASNTLWDMNIPILLQRYFPSIAILLHHCMRILVLAQVRRHILIYESCSDICVQHSYICWPHNVARSYTRLTLVPIIRQIIFVVAQYSCTYVRYDGSIVFGIAHCDGLSPRSFPSVERTAAGPRHGSAPEQGDRARQQDGHNFREGRGSRRERCEVMGSGIALLGCATPSSNLSA